MITAPSPRKAFALPFEDHWYPAHNVWVLKALSSQAHVIFTFPCVRDLYIITLLYNRVTHQGEQKLSAFSMLYQAVRARTKRCYILILKPG